MYVKNAIIHLVDKSMDGALLNNVELPVRTNQDVNSMVESLVRSLINSKYTRTCKYQDFTNSELRACTESMIYSDEEFINNSKKLAELLHVASRENNSIDSNDFLVVSYKHKDKNYVAGICLEYTQIFTNKIRHDDGMPIIELSINNKAHPKKPKYSLGFTCGLSGMNDTWDVLALDSAFGKGKKAESDFINEFLKANVVEDSRFLTNKIIELVKGWVSVNYINDLNEGLNIISDLHYSLTEGNEFNFEIFAKNYIHNDLKRKNFLLFMSEKKMSKVFDIDTHFAERKLKKIKIKNDMCTVTIKSEDLQRLRFEESENLSANVKLIGVGTFEYM